MQAAQKYPWSTFLIALEFAAMQAAQKDEPHSAILAGAFAAM